MRASPVCFLISYLLFGLAACSGDMKKYSKLQGLRVLGIVADKPEVNAPGVVNLRPFISYPEAADTRLDVSYEACLDPGLGYGAAVGCESFAHDQIIRGDFVFDTSVLGTQAFYTGFIDPIAITLPEWVFALIKKQNATRQFNGIDFIVILTLTDQRDSKASLKTVKRISISSKPDGALNQNPTAGPIQNIEGNLSHFPQTKTTFTLSSPSTPEDFESITAQGLKTFKESMYVSWFSNQGEFKFSRTDPGDFVGFDPKGSTSGVIVAVLRDNRGGLAITQQNFE